MSAPRNTTTGAPTVLAPTTTRPLTARSVIASTLLGMRPPRLDTRTLVASGVLFGIAEGTTRVALSRMAAAGELQPVDGGWQLAGPLLARHARQQVSRTDDRRPWDGAWRCAVVVPRRRSAAERAELRAAMRALRLAERREGLWLRPDNLTPGVLHAAEAVVAAQCEPWSAVPDGDPTVIAGQLWDLTGWCATAHDLAAAVDAMQVALDGHGDPALEALPAAFLLSAAVLRHLQADPLLPDQLLPADWPGRALRDRFRAFDRSFARVWQAWHRAQATSTR